MTLAYQRQSLVPPPSKHVRSIIGLSLYQAIETLSPTVPPRQIKALAEAYKAAYTEASEALGHREMLFEGAKQLIVKLAAIDHVMLGIATGKSQKGVARLLEQEKLTAYFQTIQTADDAPSKPHPGMVENALAQTGVARRSALLIGDTSFDMEMAKNSNIGAIGVAWGYHDVGVLHAAGADQIVDDFSQLETVIDIYINQ